MINTTLCFTKRGINQIGLRCLVIGLVTLFTATASYAQSFPWFPQRVSFGPVNELRINNLSITTKSVSMGDFNKDGKPDLALASNQGLSIQLGQGDGSFSAGQDIGFIPPMGSMTFIAIGDLNNDTNLDLAMTNSNRSRISVLLGIGDGTFGAPTNSEFAPFPYGGANIIAIADLDGDGNLDLAITLEGSAPNPNGIVSTVFGNGDGTFGPATDYAVGGNPMSVAGGDLNGDGKADLTVAYGGPMNLADPASGRIAVFLAEDGRTFGAKTVFNVGPGPQSIAMGDLNADGNSDIATANSSFVANIKKHVSVLLGTGNGSYNTATHFPAGPTDLVSSAAVAIGDMNKDGKLDLVTANTVQVNHQVSVLLGDGNGSFDEARTFAVSTTMGVNVRSVAIGDINEDERLDIVVAGYDGVFTFINTTWRWRRPLLIGVISGIVILTGLGLLVIRRRRR